MLIGYMRVSTGDQTTALQEDALQKAGCEKVYRDVISGAKDKRPGLSLLLEVARPGDTVVVWKLDRLGRSLRNLIDTVLDLEKRGINFRSTTENFDTSTPGGKFIFYIFGALAEMERDMIRQRTRAGLDAARARGRKGGRPRVTERIPEKTIQKARDLYGAGKMSVPDIMKLTGFKSRPTFYKYVVNDGEEEARKSKR
jgi:DNA invertase Pin-like site-specific DNA recombinase